MNAASGLADLERVVRTQWPRRRWTAKPLDGGMTNRNWRVDLADTAEAFAVQFPLPGEAAAELGIDRSTQAEVMTIVDTLGLGPRLIAWYEGTPAAIITEFIETITISTPEDRIRVAQLTARALASLHSNTEGTHLAGVVSDAFDGIDWLHAKAQRAAPDVAARFGWALEVNQLLANARGPYPRCLLHADLSVGNVLTHAGGVALIDWEYAGAGDRYFDCADFAEKWDLTVDEERAFVQKYQPGEDHDFLAAVIHMYRFASRLREGLWAATVSAAHFIDFDHLAYAEACLERLDSIAASDRFHDTIGVVAAVAGR